MTNSIINNLRRKTNWYVITGASQKKIHKLLTQIYESLPFPVIHVPVLPPEERVDFILINI